MSQTAFIVARVILHLAHERKIDVTNLKLQKLLYYCQAWHLAMFQRPLFYERIEAWVHGPVVPPVFGEYKKFRWEPLPDPGETVINDGDPSWPVMRHVSEVMDVYSSFTGAQLEALTHQEDPWKHARNGLAPDAPSSAIISCQSMIDFYGPQLIRAV